MFNRITTTIILLIITALNWGCAPTVLEYDAEKVEYDQIKKLKKAQADPFNNPSTPSYVKIADNDDVYVEAIKLKPIKGPQNIKLDVWNINAINRTKVPKCVIIEWKLQDFEFQSDQPYEFMLYGQQTLKLGQMKQTIWSFDDALIAIPPSGYVDSLLVEDAIFDKKPGKFTCEMPEKDIQEPLTDSD